MNAKHQSSNGETNIPDWFKKLRTFDKSERVKSNWQLINSLVPYFLLWGLLTYLIRNNYSFWLLPPIWILAAGFLIRIFILFHDCCHRSFFQTKNANIWVGHILGFLVFTPYHKWRISHWKHHSTAGDLDRRGVGDVWTLTKEEYLDQSYTRRFIYRFYRNPWVLLLLGPSYTFLIYQRFISRGAKPQEKKNIIILNILLILLLVSSLFTIGLKTYLIIQLPIFLLAGAGGVLLFYVQHQFKGVYWARTPKWDPFRAALEGSSFFKMPKILQWFTGNIGLHHVHHLLPSIPNYKLQKSYDAIPDLQKINPVTILDSFRTLKLNLWDEDKEKLISFKSLNSVNTPR